MSGIRLTYAEIVRVGVDAAGVKPATVKKWIARGLVTRHADGYDPDEMLQWVETVRDTGKARGAVLAAHVRHQTRRAS